jgi:hypothetical protein
MRSGISERPPLLYGDEEPVEGGGNLQLAPGALWCVCQMRFGAAAVRMPAICFPVRFVLYCPCSPVSSSIKEK